MPEHGGAPADAGQPRAERDGKSAAKRRAKRQRAGSWPERSVPEQRSEAARELRPSEGSPAGEQQDEEANIEGAQGGQGNNPGQTNAKDNIKDMKMP